MIVSGTGLRHEMAQAKIKNDTIAEDIRDNQI